VRHRTDCTLRPRIIRSAGNRSESAQATTGWQVSDGDDCRGQGGTVSLQRR